MKPQITVTIDPDGNTEVEAGGITGRSCQDLTRAIERAIGTTTEDLKKPEFHRAATQQEQQRATR